MQLGSVQNKSILSLEPQDEEDPILSHKSMSPYFHIDLLLFLCVALME